MVNSTLDLHVAKNRYLSKNYNVFISVNSWGTALRRLQWIDGLRAVAALAVMAFHYEALLTFKLPGDWPKADSQVLHLGLMGVELFFLISGYVMFFTIERAPSTWAFVVGRVARLYPAYVASVIFIGIYLFSLHEVGRYRIAVNLTMLQGFIGEPNLITPYWTLAYEIWFYLIIAMVANAGLLAFVDRISLLWLGIAFLLKLSDVEPFQGRAALLTMQKFGHLFIAGIMLYRIASGRWTALTLLALAGCILYSGFGRDDWANITPASYFFINGFFILLIWALSTGRISVSMPQWLLTIGCASYSLYLFHLPIGMILICTADSLNEPRWTALAFAVPLSFVIAFLSQRYIEKPGQMLVKGILESVGTGVSPE